MEGQQQAQGGQGAADRRRRPRLAAGALPGRGGRRHASASSISTSSTSRTCSARSSTRPADVGRPKIDSAERHASTRSTRTCKVDTLRRARSRARTRSRSSRTTTSSSTAPTTSRPATWSTTPACCSASPTSTARSSASRARRSVFARQGRPVLPLPLSRAAAAGPGAELRRGRRARRAARHHRHHPGDRDGQADPRHRRAADRPPAALRRARDALPRAEAAQGPGLPGLRRRTRRSPS